MPSTEQKIKNLVAMNAMLKAIVDAGPQAKCALDDTYSIAQITPNVGEWYLSAKCEECRAISPALADPSASQRGNPFEGKGALNFKCRQCGSEIHALADDIFPFQWMG
jgi:hypothetical protein